MGAPTPSQHGRVCCHVAGPNYTYDSTTPTQVSQFYTAQKTAYLQPGSQVGCSNGMGCLNAVVEPQKLSVEVFRLLTCQF